MSHPRIGDELQIGTQACLSCAWAISDASHVLPQDGSETATAIQGGSASVKSTVSPTACSSNDYESRSKLWYGFNRGVPIRLGSDKYAIAFEHTDLDAANNWLGTGLIALGTIGGAPQAIKASPLFSTRVQQDPTCQPQHSTMTPKCRHRLPQARLFGDRTVAWSRHRYIHTGDRHIDEFSDIRARFMHLVMVSTKTISIVYREPTNGFAGKPSRESGAVRHPAGAHNRSAHS